jgi:processive 1,2-diacylglycerol beta-glucosyltransferase
MRVLVLTASYGSGHNAAARTLATGFARAGATALIVDHFRELVHPRFERATRALYYWTLRHARTAWGLAYDLGDRMGAGSPFAFGMSAVGTAGLGRLLRKERFDAIVSVHATPAVACSTLVGLGHQVPPHTTVVTDFVAHGQWIAPRIDRYCVAAAEVRHEFIARGIPAGRIVVTGVPVRDGFTAPIEPVEARARAGLSPDVPVVLAMAGSEGGLGALPDVARTLMSASRPLQGVLLAGRDRALAEQLRRVTAGTTLRTLAYTDDVPTLMAAADVLVSKAGGMTIAEALAAELPLVMHGSLPGQEARNERFASRAGIALTARSRRALARAIDRLLTDPALLDLLRERVRSIRRPDATRTIVEAVLADRRLTGRRDA